VGPKTLAALNVPVRARLETMMINLGRLQRQNRNWGRRYIVVNIAAAAYSLAIDGHAVFERPAVVGKPNWQTPSLDGLIDRIEFHPYWHIPANIAEQEVWPKQQAHPGYFAQEGIHIVNNGLVQDPGPRNPLGAVKFVFDNPYSVYLHDTSAPGLFAREYRFLSHGCVRVSDAGDLARQLLTSDPEWPAARVDLALRGSANQTVGLRAPIPLHIVYDTAWVAEEGTIQFRNDTYRRDLASSTTEPISTAEPITDVAELNAHAVGCRG
jgi:murein L,D-transpeptidase YcbB/YkuD